MVNPLPNALVVAQAWLAGVPGFSSAMVAGQLPADPSGWAAGGFVVAGVVIGGGPSVHTGARASVVQVECWAASLRGARAPVGRAFTLAETIINACIGASESADGLVVSRTLTLPGTMPQARCLTVFPVGEPVRIPADPANYAHVNLPMQFDWIPL